MSRNLPSDHRTYSPIGYGFDKARVGEKTIWYVHENGIPIWESTLGNSSGANDRQRCMEYAAELNEGVNV